MIVRFEDGRLMNCDLKLWRGDAPGCAVQTLGDFETDMGYDSEAGTYVSESTSSEFIDYWKSAVDTVNRDPDCNEAPIMLTKEQKDRGDYWEFIYEEM